MSIDRQGARRRVKTVTVWAAAGAAAMTAGLAFGASRDRPAASTAAAPAPARPEVPQEVQPQPMAPQQTAPQQTVPPSSGYEPPAASSGPPAGMSGGS